MSVSVTETQKLIIVKEEQQQISYIIIKERPFQFHFCILFTTCHIVSQSHVAYNHSNKRSACVCVKLSNLCVLLQNFSLKFRFTRHISAAEE